MHLHYVLLLVSGVFFGSAKANCVATNSIPSTATLADSLTAGKNDVHDLQFLSPIGTAYEDNGERSSTSTAAKDDDESSTSTADEQVEERGLLWDEWEKLKDMLMHDRVLDNNLASPDLPSWIKYLDDFNQANPSLKTDAIDALRKKYGEKAVFKMLEAAKKISITDKLATELQKEQIESWSKLQYSPNDVFEVLMQDRALDDILTSPNMPVWTKYLDDFNKANPSHKTDAIGVLLDNYNKLAVFEMLEVATNDLRTQELATKLLNKQIKQWEKFEYKPEDVFTELELNVDLDSILNPLLQVWYRFAESFYKKKKQAEVIVDDVHTMAIQSMRLYYLDSYLLKLLIDVKEDPIFSELKEPLFMAWVYR